MSPFILLLASAALLVSPWAMRPPSSPRKPEVRGLLLALWWLNVAYCVLWHRLKPGPLAPLPEHGPAILIANHTSAVDNLLLQAGCRRVLGFMVATEFYDYPLIHPLCVLLKCIPVRRDGRDVSGTRAALRALKDGRVLPLFPEGRITPRSGEVIGEGRPGAAFLALHARVPVIPAYIRGTPPTNQLWKSLFTPSDARVVYGPPIEPGDYSVGDPDGKPDLDAVTRRFMDAIRGLKDRSLCEERSSLT